MSQDYFSLFQLAPTFQQDGQLIQSHYYTLQQKAHPDNFVNATAPEKQAAQRFAATINDAYQTLKDPFKRALYLLKINGVDLLNEQTTTLPPELLMEQLELRETWADIRHSDQGEANVTFKEKINTALLLLEKELHLLHEKCEIDHIKKLLWQIQFYRKLQEEISQWHY